MTSSSPGTSTADLLQSLSADMTALVRQELGRAQDELTSRARQAGRAGALLGGAGVLSAMALGSSATLLRRILERRLPPTAAAAVTTVLLGAGAGVLGTTARDQLRRAWPLMPADTVAGVREDVRTVADAAGAGPAPRS
jgi:Putative Actinobacterial Holin-X, holin superfamily III